MLATLALIIFLGFMVYWFGFVQGFFSGFLHLMIVIVSGALAFALWEPVAQGMLYKWMGGQAWGAGLLFPFVIILLVLRFTMDKLVPDNIDFSKLVNMIGGGACGLFAGILSAGIVIIGMCFLAFGANIGGYAPLAVLDDNRVDGTPGTGLVGGTVVTTAGFYTMLSGGAFGSGQPLNQYLPDLARQAALYRLRTEDANASVAISPASVSLMENYYVSGTKIPGVDRNFSLSLRDDLNAKGKQIVCIDTEFKNSVNDRHAFDGDKTLRIQATQVQLITWTDPPGSIQVHTYAPIGFSRLIEPATGKRVYHCLNVRGMSKAANRSDEQQRIGWFFVVPNDHKPKFFMVRRLRLPVGKKVEDEEQMRQMIGTWDDAPFPDDVKKVSDPQLFDEISMTKKLPVPISRNFATGMNFDGKNVMEGSKHMAKPPRYPSPAVRVDGVYIPAHQSLVRIRMRFNKAREVFGETEASPLRKNYFWLEDSKGRKWYSIGYVLYKANKALYINIDRNGIKQGTGLPMKHLGRGDGLYLFIPVQKDVKLNWFKVGDNSADAENVVAKIVDHNRMQGATQVAVGQTGPIIVEPTNALPAVMPTEPFGSGIKGYQRGRGVDKTEQELIIEPPAEQLGATVRADWIWSPKSKPLVRVKMTNVQVMQVFGEALKKNQTRGEILVKDQNGRKFGPVAYVMQQLNKTQRIAVRHKTDQGLQFQHLPIAQMTDGDKLFLYFEVQSASRNSIKELIFQPFLGDEVRLEIEYPKNKSGN